MVASNIFNDILLIIADLKKFKADNVAANKAAVQAHFFKITKATKQRSVFACGRFAFRFSEANAGSFSNVVLSLSALKQYDGEPFIICIVRPRVLEFRLSNTSFLKRISHSSHTLTTTNVRGSFLGHDIFGEFEGLANSPENFEQLFALHEAFNWDENLERLVAATTSISPRLARFDLTTSNSQIILLAPDRTARTLSDPAVMTNIERSLEELVLQNRTALLAAAEIDNVNLRGNAIEQIITAATNEHRLDDLTYEIPNGRLIVDIKTKLLDRASAPKGYNIDKMLRLLSDETSEFAFFFIGLNVERNLVKTRLVSIFDPRIVQATRIQTHWAGRASRGVTQLTGDISSIFDAEYRTSVDRSPSVALLRSFIER